MSEPVPDAVDVVFAVGGAALPGDYSFGLVRAIARHLPWFDGDSDAGVHPLRGARTDYGAILLPRRAKLVLRVTRPRTADALALIGRRLEIGSGRLEVGVAAVRELRPHAALYAHLVANGCGDEEAFLASVGARLAALAARGTPVCGRRHSLRAGEREIVGFSLMLHDLSPEHSLLLQRIGLGGERKLGCGIFVPHRLAAAVGSA
jgi:CRISPR-associated protein Cas6